MSRFDQCYAAALKARAENNRNSTVRFAEWAKSFSDIAEERNKARCLLASVYLTLNQREAAIAEYVAAIEEEPDSVGLRLALLDTMVHGNLIKEANCLVQKSRQLLKPRYFKFLQARNDYLLGNWEVAAKALSHFLENKPNGDEISLWCELMLEMGLLQDLRDYLNASWQRIKRASVKARHLETLESIFVRLPTEYIPERFIEEGLPTFEGDWVNIYRRRLQTLLLRRAQIDSRTINYPVFAISLDKDVQRIQRIRKHCDTIGVPFTKVSAVDGSVLQLEQLSCFSRQMIRSRLSWLDLGALGCWLSHINIWRNMVAEEIAVALILEDDGYVSAPLPASMDAFEFPENFDLVYVNDRAAGDNQQGGVFATGVVPAVDEFRRKIKFELAGGRANGTDGYFLSLAGARKLLARVELGEIALGIDPFLRSSARAGLIDPDSSYPEFRPEVFSAYVLEVPLVFHIMSLASDRIYRVRRDENPALAQTVLNILKS